MDDRAFDESRFAVVPGTAKTPKRQRGPPVVVLASWRPTFVRGRARKAHVAAAGVLRVQKALRLGILVAILMAGGALAFAGAMPEGYRGVGEVAGEPQRFQGKTIDVKASVLEGSLRRDATPMTFLLVEGAQTLEVRWDPAHPIPDHEAGGTIEGKNVVVHGTLVRDGDNYFLAAHEMTVGCASKYRPAE